MRKIKFRGKTMDTGKWVFGDLLQYRVLPIIFDKNKEQHDVSGKTVGQFTGLYDKNGTEIYEGDVLRKDWAETFNYYEIEFKDGAWLAFEMINFRHGSPIVSEFNALPGCLPRSMWKFAKVIGNIHDNPDIHETLMK